MKNRKLPFGYALHGGEIVINQSEAKPLNLFRNYLYLLIFKAEAVCAI